MRIAFWTLGCKVNQYETQSMREEFVKMGHTVVSENETFDMFVINSCTVTAESDRKTRQLLRRIKRQNPEAVAILTGCMVQAFPKISEQLPEADIIVGNTDIKRIITLAEEFLENKKRTASVLPHLRNECFNTPAITDFEERTRAYMKIEDGCDRYCSYCIIPYARGFVRSRELEDIRKEAENLALKGYLEIVLVGINLSAYGKGEDKNLCDAVETVCAVEGIKRVRLGSLEPDHITDEMLSRFKAQPKFCPQFHLSLQSGCDATLKRMNRHYDSAFYYDLVLRIRKMFPDAAITTDIMVGFAGETDEEFAQSLEFFRKVKFAKAHVFSYSRREGTVAYALKDQVSNAEKARRSKLMMEAAEKSEQEFLGSLIGKTVKVLFETPEGEDCIGYTENYCRVRAKSAENISGEIKNVTITAVTGDICEGVLA